MGLGTSPGNVILLFFASGSGIGMAESKAWVYGCNGCSNSSSVSAISTNFPRYMTAIL